MINILITIDTNLCIEMVASEGQPSRAKTTLGRNSATVVTGPFEAPAPLSLMSGRLGDAWTFLGCTDAQRHELRVATEAFDELVATVMGLRKQWFGEEA